MIYSDEDRNLNADQRALLERITMPIDWPSFLSKYWGKSFLHCLGTQGRFDSLLNWSEINSLLEQHRLKPPRLRLFNDGKEIDANNYLIDAHTDRPRLRTGGLLSCLSAGATLIVNQIDEIVPALREIAEAFEDVLRLPTSVSLYAGWRTREGFHLHWDPQDTFILQLFGKKHWQVYAQTRAFPLTEDIVDCPKPTADPIWDDVLQNGDMIYMPRGWWHLASPLNEPSLHLTITVQRRNGGDFLRWMIERMKLFPSVRMDLPHIEESGERQHYISELRALFHEVCTLENEQIYLREEYNKMRVRPRLDLPLLPMNDDSSIAPETRVQLADVRGLTFESNGTKDERATFRIGGKRWSCPQRLLPALRMLSGKRSHSIAELFAELPRGAVQDELVEIVAALRRTGIIRTVESR